MAWNHSESSHKRGYGRDHRKRRAALIPLAIGQPCPMCDVAMKISDQLDLDHSTPLALGGTVGDRIVHRKCNQLAGAKLGYAMANKRTPASRAW
jgi:hypothetical protein